MLVKTYSSAVHGVRCRTITVRNQYRRQSCTPGNQCYFLVGLPDNVVREGFQRIEAGRQKQWAYNMLRVKTVVNLAPADIRKEGSAYDLPIAVGYPRGNGPDHQPGFG
jgi:magnesium chelatase family protein